MMLQGTYYVYVASTWRDGRGRATRVRPGQSRGEPRKSGEREFSFSWSLFAVGSRPRQSRPPFRMSTIGLCRQAGRRPRGDAREGRTHGKWRENWPRSTLTRTFDLSRLDKLDRRQVRHRAASSARVCSAARWSDTFVAADPTKSRFPRRFSTLTRCYFVRSVIVSTPLEYDTRVPSAHFQNTFIIRRALSICRRLAEKRQLSFADSKYTCSRRFSFKKSLYLWPTFHCTLFLPEVACTGCGSIDKDSLNLLHTRKMNERFYRYPYKNIETHHARRHRKYVD